MSSPQGLGGVSSKATAGAVTAAPDVRSTVPLQSTQGRQISYKCKVLRSYYNLLGFEYKGIAGLGVGMLLALLLFPLGMVLCQECESEGAFPDPDHCTMC